MTIAVILILGVLWMVVLLPPILRARSQQGRADSIGDFRYRLSALGHTNGHRMRSHRMTHRQPIFVPTGVGPGRMSPAQRRRRDVLFVLLGGCAATLFLAALTRGAAFVALQLLSDVVLGAYVYLLVQHKRRMEERRSKVRYLNATYEPNPYFANGFSRREPASVSGPRLVPLRQTVSS